jgi:hypothetical protein
LNFVGGSKKGVNNVTPDSVEFVGSGGHKESDNVFKKTKHAFEQRDQDIFGGRAPVHQGSAPNAKVGGRGNSPATGALAVPQSETAPISSSNNESKPSSLNHQASSATINNCEDSF